MTKADLQRADLLLERARRDQVYGFFEDRAAAVDGSTADIREGIAFLGDHVLAQAADDVDATVPNGDLVRIAETIATVAWCDMSSAFSLWCHRMVQEYLSWAPPASPARVEALPRLVRTEHLGSTALASAMAHYLSGTPLPITARREGRDLILSGRVHWASNLFPPDFTMVVAATDGDDGRPIIVVVPGGEPGLRVDPYPRLLALQATGSSSLALDDVCIGEEWIVTDDFTAFIEQVRPTFLLLQSSFCWGLAARALAQAREVLHGVNEVLRPDLEEMEALAEHQALQIRRGLSVRQTPPAMRDAVQLRLDAAQLATSAVALEAKASGGRGYVTTSATARRLREAAFLPIQAPTEGQLRWELTRSA